MKHAGSRTLDFLELLLQKIRCTCLSLKEKKRGIFYLKSKSYLHFHEDKEGLFADLRQGETFLRFRVSTEKEQELFLETLLQGLK